MDKVRWGLLSTANINKAVIPAIRSSLRGELAAVASRSQRQAKHYAQRWEIPGAFGSYEAMLASEEIDAVYIGLPNYLHAEWSIRAMQQGKYVLCENRWHFRSTKLIRWRQPAAPPGGWWQRRSCTCTTPLGCRTLSVSFVARRMMTR